jgi:hypothetical protein
VNEFIAHPRNGRPRDLSRQVPSWWRDTLDRFANDFQLADDPILDEALGVEGCLVNACQIGLYLRNGIHDVPEIDRIIALHTPPADRGGCVRAGRDSARTR